MKDEILAFFGILNCRSCAIQSGKKKRYVRTNENGMCINSGTLLDKLIGML